jgi:hypothetical protein
MIDESDNDTLARDMIDVHGTRAAAVARENARTAALAGQGMQARSWIRVLGIIQRRQVGRAPPIWNSANRSADDTTPEK